MKKFLMIAATASIASAAMVLSAQAQQVLVDEVKVRSINADTQITPEFQAGGGVKIKNIPYPRDWLEVEVAFEAKANQRNAVIPELLFRYYVAVKGKDGAVKILTGDVIHTNVVSGDKYFSAVYVAPATLGAITGDFRRFQVSAVQAIAVEILHNGVVKGGKSSGGPGGRWWEGGAAPQPGVRGRDKTPFALLWIDRYADIKETQ